MSGEYASPWLRVADRMLDDLSEANDWVKGFIPTTIVQDGERYVPVQAQDLAYELELYFGDLVEASEGLVKNWLSGQTDDYLLSSTARPIFKKCIAKARGERDD
jgi:hypothetical protein